MVKEGDMVREWNTVFISLYPRCPQDIRDKTIDLLIKKQIPATASSHINNVLASVIRHNNTHYHMLLQRVDREHARGLVSHLVKKDINYFKGELP
jgi:hypothetical protein